LLDRIDLHVPVPAPTFDEVCAPGGEASTVVRERVLAARRRQAARAEPGGTLHTNASIPATRIRSRVRLGQKGQGLLRHAVDRLSLSARGLDRILRVAQTISDLADSEEIEECHLAEALHFRRTWDTPLTAP
jgi:magnesium chelatase family protein